MNVSVASIVKGTLTVLVQVVVAIWTYREAKRQGERPFTWAAFALFFGLIAVVLFYLFLLIKELKQLNKVHVSSEE